MMSELEAIASHPSEDNVFRVGDYGDVNIILHRLFNTICDGEHVYKYLYVHDNV